MKLPNSRILPLVAGFAVIQSLSAQVAVLDFDGGNGTTSVDQYEGIAGDGWTTSWVSKVKDASISGTAASGSLYATLTTNGVDTGHSGTLSRAFDGTSSGVDVSESFQISFDFTPETALTTGVGYMIFSNASAQANTVPGNPFQIRANDGGSGTWLLFNGNKSGGVVNTIDTGMTVVDGTTYSFLIDMNPSAQEYTVSISDGSSVYDSMTLGYRSSGYASVNDVFLSFGAFSNQESGTVNFSVDNISVIPEPSTLAYLAFTFLLVGFVGLRRRPSGKKS